ncbi:unnamed protein product [Paramecium octaurelia]|uniref:Protein kinase domain-containing protein n=1 Tax=Paramecium octaurelia TaxID=43137 RepID=A0A8S1Y6I3_PAROT|nr:unnamed protein product [Paramecium octaurelia]
MSQLSRQMKKIGNYQLGDLLGRGSIGTVYKGLNLELGTLVAIKQVSRATLKEDQYKALQQEIYLLKKLKHENIVKYIDCIETDQFLNIILEYIESGSLASILKKFGSFPESLVAIYVKQVLKGLEYLHQQGIVHRDIKGANILTTKDGTVKLADFGVATTLSEDTTQSNNIVGTPYWMAPEVIEMSGHLSTSCDIWSLGCTVIELLTGNPPYFDRLQYAAMFQIVQRDCPPLPEGISNECRDFLIQCFQKDPTLRDDATTMLKHPWITKSWHIVQGPNLPEEVTNTIRNHIVDQSNFGTFITDSFIEQVPQLVQCQSPRKIDKSSAVRDSQLDSLRQLKLRTSHQIKQNGFWGQNEDGKSMREINELITQLTEQSDNSQIIKILEQLKDTIPNDKCKEYFIHTGLTSLLEIIEKYMPLYCENNSQDQSQSLQILKLIFELINIVVDQNPQLLELSCYLGAATFYQQITSSEFHKELRVEAAYFLGQLTYFKEGFLLSIGGLDNLLELIDTSDISDNIDLIGLALDTIILLYDLNTISQRNLSRLLTSKFITYRLVLIAEQIQNIDVNLMIKSLNILVILAKCDDKIVKQSLCEKEVITRLATFLNQNQEQALLKTIKIFRYLSTEPNLQPHLDGFAIIPRALTLLKKDLPSQGPMIADILRIIFYLTKLNHDKQEELCLYEGVPLLLELFKLPSEQENQISMKKAAISILCSLATSSERCKQKLQENGGISIYVGLLTTNLNITKLLDTIVKLIELDQTQRIPLSKNIDILVAYFKNNTVPMYPTLVKVLPKEFGLSILFRKQLLELLIQKDQSQLNLKHLLQILYYLLESDSIKIKDMFKNSILQKSMVWQFKALQSKLRN